MAYTFFTVLFLVVCFGTYKLLKRRKAKLLWDPKDENKLKDILNKIDSSMTLENLDKVFLDGINSYPNYHDIFYVAKEEKRQQMTQEIQESFEKRENMTRKKWLLFFSVYNFALWLILLYVLAQEGLEIIAILTALVAATMWIIYHCAYKKKGTALLTLIVVVMPIRLLLSLLKEGIDFSMWYIDFANIVIFGFYWFSSFHLRKINKEAKIRNQMQTLKEVLK